LAVLSLAVLAGAAAPTRANVPGLVEEDVDLTALSLEELMAIEVTIASRSSQKLSEVPGAVYVITGDEIRRAGHTSIPEALRMVPGFYVSNWTTSKWDVTSRGFGTGVSLTSLAFLNQLLVMIDGVVVYSPLFAGTWWEIQDVDLDDIDRIEVIRGPGGILWGSNAVHGVVNIISKSSADTQGFRASVRGQNDEAHASGRAGGTFGETGSYRVYYKHSDYETNHNPFLDISQAWYLRSTGFRADWGDGRKNVLWGRAYQGEFDADGFDVINLVTIPVVDQKEGFQLFGSTTDADGDGTFTAWLNYDKQDLPTEIDFDIVTYDLEYKHDFRWSDSSKTTAGVGFRQTRSDLEGDDPFFITFSPEEYSQESWRAFAVQTWMCADLDLDFVLGAQLENNDFTDWEFQPTGRVSWHPGETFSMWAAVTKSARTPSLEEVHLDQNSADIGDPNFESEDALAYELGVRQLLGDYAVLDFATFYNDYDNLHHAEPNGLGQNQLSNQAEGESYGVEVALDLKPCKAWSLRSAYTLLAGSYTSKIDGSDLGTEDQHPRHQFNLRSYYDIAEDWELDMAAYFVEDMGEAFAVAERWRLDLRVGWQPTNDLQLYVGAQQLNENTESEFDEFDNRRRQFYFGLKWTPGSDGGE
jgi:iron complex outermembrane receptor protein